MEPLCTNSFQSAFCWTWTSKRKRTMKMRWCNYQNSVFFLEILSAENIHRVKAIEVDKLPTGQHSNIGRVDKQNLSKSGWPSSDQKESVCISFLCNGQSRH
ncbi:uncharacterized protein LOC119768886 [Culex quinquefasciatus]|uniref:uncharacterized protein LOC119768886 n=1 Tax=Culex quinquefasciatus TaxID=7176 RepID=UPI0018E2D3B2|nr:uncharacterized protein LOC119768886 [Culex quinquefasciatus]